MPQLCFDERRLPEPAMPSDIRHETDRPAAAAPRAAIPGVVILGGAHGTLALARSLGARKVPVWLVSDDTPLPGGAEDAAYLGGQPGYRTAGTLMADPSELRAVAGVTAESYAKLRPWICALPRAERSRINVNTLTPEQAPLLAMLLPDGSGMAGARAILMRRPPGGYANRDAIWKPAGQAGISADPLAADQADVTSRWFALRVEVTVRGTTMQERGLIDASALPARLVSRQWGEL